jgi:hypothetical protein
MRETRPISVDEANFRHGTEAPTSLDPSSCVGARSSAAQPKNLQKPSYLLALLVLIARGYRMLDAMPHMVAEQLLLDAAERRADRRNLRYDINAVAVFLDHAGDAANLTFNPG